ncbi:MAG: putative cation-transporting ATPase [Planctomycetota bacterium]
MMNSITGNDDPATQWSVQSIDQIRQHFQTSEKGLEESKVKISQKTLGLNALAEKPPTPIWVIIFRQFQSPLILILVAAAGLSLLTSDAEDAFFIGIVLLLNTILGSSQEYRAERGALALKHLITVQATVQREGIVQEINAVELVPGDRIFLESGNIVPADIRLESSNGLEVDESILTGESLATTKESDWLATQATSLAEIQNMLFAGTTIARGRATGIVVETGTRTEVGKIASDVATQESGLPPLVKRMQHFSQTIGIAVLIVAVMLAVLEFFIHQSSVAESFEFAVALAISAIPEGLPIALTITLAVGSSRMSKRNAIIRRLAAVEGLGSCTLIATDKTGTLTCNELTVKKIRLADQSGFEVSGEGYSVEGTIAETQELSEESAHLLNQIILTGLLCNEADLVPKQEGGFHRHGDAVDLALLVLGLKAGMQRDNFLINMPEVHSIPFEPELQFSAVWNYDIQQGQTICNVKGSPERVLAMCEIHEDHLDLEMQSIRKMASEGYRVIALASKRREGKISKLEFPEHPENLHYLGCVGMIDPPRSGVRKAIEQCHEAGVEIIMVTGDHRLTAMAIAKDLGIISENDNPKQVVFNGTEIETGNTEEIRQIIEQGRVFARVSPRQKLELVKAAQDAGHFVAVTGDGANDAPALTTANIAVAMGKSGTDITRESADLVLSDDNFATIVAGIEEGRIAFDNIRKVIVLLVSTGIGEIIMVLLALLTGLPLPLTPLQLLWLNVATEAIQDEALAFEPNEGDAMRRKPRPPQEPIFNRIMIERILVGAMVMGILGFALFATMIQMKYSVFHSRNALLMLMVLFENFHIGNCRSELKSVFRLSPLSNPLLILGVFLAFSVHIIAMHTPWLQRILQVGPIDIKLIGVLVIIAFTIIPAVELHKWFCRRRQKTVSIG